MNNLKNIKLPPASTISSVVGLLVGGTTLTWAANNSLFNVEGGHRAIVFNRFVGIKEQVREMGYTPSTLTALHHRDDCERDG
jgi:prohibitin 2